MALFVKMKFLVLASLLFTVCIDNIGTSACARGSGDSYGHRDEFKYRRLIKRSIDNNSYKFDSNDLGHVQNDAKVRKTLVELFDAIRHSKILSNESEMRKLFDPNVARFLKEKSIGESRSLNPSSDEFTDENCPVIIRGMHPKEHHLAAHFVVHATNFNQVIEVAECINAGETCDNNKDSSESQKSTCKQVYREQELLTLPTGREDYDLSDFKINKFKVPNGCQCALSQELFHILE